MWDPHALTRAGAHTCPGHYGVSLDDMWPHKWVRLMTNVWLMTHVLAWMICGLKSGSDSFH